MGASRADPDGGGDGGGGTGTAVRETVLGFVIALDAGYLDAPEREVRRQLAEYSEGARRYFDLGIRFPDTFAGSVWRLVSDIPYGETRTYGELASEHGTAPVAIGGANAANPLPVVVPCHRVVGVDSFRGYRYPGMKEALLRHENPAGLRALGFELDGRI